MYLQLHIDDKHTYTSTTVCIMIYTHKLLQNRSWNYHQKHAVGVNNITAMLLSAAH